MKGALEYRYTEVQSGPELYVNIAETLRLNFAANPGFTTTKCIKMHNEHRILL